MFSNTSNRGVTMGTTTKGMEVLTAQLFGAGVKLYVVVPGTDSFKGGDQAPGIPLSDKMGNAKLESFWQALLKLENKGVSVLPQVIVKLLLEISKKVPAAEITITRAVVVDTFGHTMASEPSFAVVLFKTNG